MKKILVPINFTEDNDNILQATLDQARNGDSEVILLNVEPPDPEFVGYSAGPESVRETVSEGFKKDHQMLEDFKNKLIENGLQNVKALQVQGNVKQQILAEAQKNEIDLIILRKHHYRTFHDLLRGSITKGIIKKAPCNILIVR